VCVCVCVVIIKTDVDSRPCVIMVLDTYFVVPIDFMVAAMRVLFGKKESRASA